VLGFLEWVPLEPEEIQHLHELGFIEPYPYQGNAANVDRHRYYWRVTSPRAAEFLTAFNYGDYHDWFFSG